MRRICIGIDARELCGRPTGVGRYLSHLLAAWAESPEAQAHRFVLYVPAAEAGDRSIELASGGLHSVEIRRLPGSGGTFWEQVRLPRAVRRDRLDVLFSPAYSAPAAVRVPVVLTIHDLSYLAHPEWFPPRMRLRYRLTSAIGTRRAAHILTDSACSAAEIQRLLGVPVSRITVVPLGVTRPDRARTVEAPRQPAESADPLVLYVGSVFNRRHLPDLIRAVAVVVRRRDGVRLEIVGDNRTYPPQDLEAEARAAGIADRVTVRSYVSDDVLADLYGRARVFAFLSDYEGFGLTPLEALSSGVPVLVGDTAVAREVYGDAAWRVATRDVDAIAAALEALLFDPAVRARHLEAAPEILGRYSWDRAGRDTLAVLLAAAHGTGGGR